MHRYILLGLSLLPLWASAQNSIKADICIYGASAGGVIAASAAARLGHTVVLLEPGVHIGGMTTGGLGYTDIGNKYAITGMSQDFYRRIGRHYGTFEGWQFEPSVAEAILMDYIKSPKITLIKRQELLNCSKEGTTITQITTQHVERPGSIAYIIQAKQYIDCSYEGDLMAQAKVSYTVGREDNQQYGERYNGYQLMDGHQMPDSVSAYRTAGVPGSGLLYGVSIGQPDSAGRGDKRLQAYNYRLCLTDDSKNRIDLAQPEAYNPEHYELFARMVERMERRKPIELENLFILHRMPNGKSDWNHKGGFSLDFIGENHTYPEASYNDRRKQAKAHENYIKGLLYFTANSPRIPQRIRDKMRTWGWPKNEFKETQGFPHQLYVREARRMVGAYVMTEHNCVGDSLVKDGVGMAAYTMDSHNCQRITINGFARNEGNVEKGGFPPYPISYRSLTPKASECTNLLVPVCLSASHIAYGSIRMEPVFMVLGQSCALAASMAIKGKKAVQMIDVAKLQQRLKANPLLDGSVADILLDNADDDAVKANGAWQFVTLEGETNQFGKSILVSENQKAGQDKVVFTPTILKDGYYKVYFYCGGKRKKATDYHLSKNQTVTVRYHGGGSDIEVDLEQNANTWKELGRFEYRVGGYNWVETSSDGSGKAIVADAVQWVYEGSK